MSENLQDKTEAPTPKRQREARDEGKVPRTQELSAATVLLGAGLMVGPGGAAVSEALAELARVSFISGASSLSDPRVAVAGAMINNSHKWSMWENGANNRNHQRR